MIPQIKYSLCTHITDHCWLCFAWDIYWKLLCGCYTLKAAVMESPILNLIGINSFRYWVRLQNTAVSISTTHYPTHWMVNACQPRQYSIGTDWNGRHLSCCHFGWSLPSRLTVQYCVHFLLNKFAFYHLRASCHIICTSIYWCVL